MSKEAALRAMREARYRERTEGATPARRMAMPTARPASEATPAATADPTGTLCGHRSMNGRTCTREQGHAAKSHRYG